MAIVKLLLTIPAVAAAGLCVVAAMDRKGALEAAWEKVLPSRVLSGRPSAEEALVTDTAQRLAATRKRAEDIQRQRQASLEKRARLAVELKARLERVGVPDGADAGELMSRDPIVAATIRAVAAEDDRLAEADQELAVCEAEASAFEARLIGIKSGLGPAIAAGSLSQQIEKTGTKDSPADRYGRILREATSRPSMEKP